MAELKDYTVVHPVRHNGRLYPRGTAIPLGDKDALRLLDKGAITSGTAVVVVVSGPSTSESLESFNRLSKMTKDQLVAHGLTTYNLTLDEKLEKEKLIAALHQAYVDGYNPVPVTV